MTPYDIAAGSLFMVKEATLQKILQSVSDATGADPTRLQDSLVGLGVGGLAGGGIGGLANGTKGAIIGSLLGGTGGAAGGYAGSPFVREMLQKLMGGEKPMENPAIPGEAQKVDPAAINVPEVEALPVPDSMDALADVPLTDPGINPAQLSMDGENMGALASTFEGAPNVMGPTFPGGIASLESKKNMTTSPGQVTGGPADPFEAMRQEEAEHQKLIDLTMPGGGGGGGDGLSKLLSTITGR